MKPLQVIKIDSNDGDTHYIFLDLKPSEQNQHAQEYNEIEVKNASKKEASKPLSLKRTE